MAAVGVPMRTLQEWMGHRDFTTTLIYADFAPDPAGGAAFAALAFGGITPDATSRRTVRRGSPPMASIEERIYELGIGALAEQERQVAEVRGRGAAILAAGAVIASLLTGSVFHDGHPSGWLEISATAIGLLGCGGVLLFVVAAPASTRTRLQRQGRSYIPLPLGAGHRRAADGRPRTRGGFRGASRREHPSRQTHRVVPLVGARLAGARDGWLRDRGGAKLVGDVRATEKSRSGACDAAEAAKAGLRAQAASDDLQPREARRIGQPLG